MFVKRAIYNHLLKWKNKPNRKPLIIRGARQVGKTTLLKTFSKEFNHQIYYNLEKTDQRDIFEKTEHFSQLINYIFTKHNISIEKRSQTILVIDEIQESPKAIHFLRYFYEEQPELNVIAAGSLLEYAIRNTHNFPVGRVEFLYLYPFNFSEYLDAKSDASLSIGFNHIPIQEEEHVKLLKEYKLFAKSGGMPEVIKFQMQNIDEEDNHTLFESLWSTFQNDLEKYTPTDEERRITKHILDTAPRYVDQMVELNHFGKSKYSEEQILNAFKYLSETRIIQLIFPTTDTTFPFVPDLNLNPKLFFLDTGILNHCLNLSDLIEDNENLLNVLNGAIISHLFTQELISSFSTSRYNPVFWYDKTTDCTIDLVYSYRSMIIPIEVEKPKKTCSQNLERFMDECNHAYCIKLSNKPFQITKETNPSGKTYKVMHLPYYLGTKLNEYIEWFTKNH